MEIVVPQSFECLLDSKHVFFPRCGLYLLFRFCIPDIFDPLDENVIQIFYLGLGLCAQMVR